MFNLNYEKERLQFVMQRDGVDAAMAFARQMIKQYRDTCHFVFKKKLKSKNNPYRFSYLESAMSARYLLRSDFFKNV